MFATKGNKDKLPTLMKSLTNVRYVESDLGNKTIYAIISKFINAPSVNKHLLKGVVLKAIT